MAKAGNEVDIPGSQVEFLGVNLFPIIAAEGQV